MRSSIGHAVVAGAAGQVGEGVVAALLRRGWSVTGLGRRGPALDGVAARLGHPEGLRLQLLDDSPQAWSRLAHVLEPPDLAVVSLGGWFSGPALTALPLADWTRVLDDGLTAHVQAAGALLPLLEAGGGGTYVMVNGGAALGPVPGSGAVSVVAAAQLMLARVLAAEAQAAVVRALVIRTPVLTRSRPVGPEGWVSATDVGDTVHRLHLAPGTEVVVALDRPGDGAVSM